MVISGIFRKGTTPKANRDDVEMGKFHPCIVAKIYPPLPILNSIESIKRTTNKVAAKYDKIYPAKNPVLGFFISPPKYEGAFEKAYIESTNIEDKARV
ncbi:MAG: hypothetical protein MPF33_10810 [Candidatus Aramenus sp.]|jgi:hypothetical protein|nr:hypothetical protein [Candidatus Aramenus sp.]